MPGAEDYTSLGQDANPRLWVPVLVGLALFMVIFIVASLLGLL